MELIFLDTSFLVAYYNSDDVNHEEARKLIMRMKGKQVRFLISDYIFDETLTVLLVRAGKDKAIKVCNAILRDIKLENIELVYVNKEIFRKTTTIFVRFTISPFSKGGRGI
ncbi:PIN domain-containing protein [Candidatus Poribacteria bacterium]|nr:PIN domain-containing protein [Candidatus Poribacteria bacterium]